MLNSLFWLCEIRNCDIISGRRTTHYYPSEKVLCTSLLKLDTKSQIGLYAPINHPYLTQMVFGLFKPWKFIQCAAIILHVFKASNYSYMYLCITLITDVNIELSKHTCNSYCKKNDERLQDHFSLRLRIMKSLPEYLDLQSTGFIPVFIHGKLAGNRWLANWQIHFLKLTCPE